MNRVRYRTLLTLMAAVVLLGGCATKIPPQLADGPAVNPAVDEVRADPARFKGSEVRWGGVIARVENRADVTWVEMVEHPLGRSGEPQSDSGSRGRFIASFSGFLDPVIYGSGRLLTLRGTISDETSRAIGEYEYRFPVVGVTAHYLWPLESELPSYYDYPPPRWYYDPWYPFGWPYPRPYPPHRH